MGEILKLVLIPVLNDLLDKLQQGKYWLFIIMAMCFILLILIIIKLTLFYFGNKKTINEIGKIGQEHIKGLLENTEFLYIKRDKKLESDKIFFDKTYELIERLKEHEDLKMNRDIIEYKELFRDCTYKKLQEYMNYFEIVHKEDKKSMLHFIQNDIKLALRNISDFQIFINSNRIKNITEHSEYQSTKEEIFDYYYFAKKHTNIFNTKTRKILNQHFLDIGVDFKLVSFC